MEKFIKSFFTANNKPGVIQIYHKLFDGGQYKCDRIHVICDENRIGVKLKGRELYVPIDEITKIDYQKNKFIITSDKQCITVICE